MIICDIDGVLADFDNNFDSYIRKQIPTLGKPDLSKWDFRDKYPSQDPEVIDELWKKFVSEGMFFYSEPYPDIQKVNVLRPVIVTSRPKEAANDTYAWLIKNKIEFESIILARDKSKFVKDAELIFEDKYKNILPFAKAGVASYLFDQPYNRDASHSNITRVKCWGDIDTNQLAQRYKK